MPCYGFQLRKFSRNPALFLVNTIAASCHGESAVLTLSLLVLAQILSPQIGRAQPPADQTKPPADQVKPPADRTKALPAPPVDTDANVARPDFAVRVPRPSAPAKGEEDLTADVQEESEKGVWHGSGHVDV